MEVNQLSDRRHEYHVSSMMFEADCGIMDIVGEVGELCSFQPPTHPLNLNLHTENSAAWVASKTCSRLVARRLHRENYIIYGLVLSDQGPSGYQRSTST